MKNTKIKTLTWEEITKLNMTKTEFAAYIGIIDTFDTALPQAWLNDFVATHDLDYHRVLYSTFATYPKNSGIKIISGWKDAAIHLITEN